ncbi:MAG: DNA-directed RNA polymerase specialized sigma24 family protein [Planctomycetota bacterium]
MLVLDATANELLAAAIHLANDADTAEDLVQATFLPAIDRAQDFDAKRLLMPWLMGILSNHARNQHRTFERVVPISLEGLSRLLCASQKSNPVNEEMLSTQTFR